MQSEAQLQGTILKAILIVCDTTKLVRFSALEQKMPNWRSIDKASKLTVALSPLKIATIYFLSRKDVLLAVLL